MNDTNKLTRELSVTSAAGALEARFAVQQTEAGSNPSAVLHVIKLMPIPLVIAKKLLVRYHYLHSFPGGTMLSLGIFIGNRLLGTVTLGAGPYMGYRLVKGAYRDDCITLTRLWLADELPLNSESRVLGMVLRSLSKDTTLKAYSDPAAGHTGTIYQATNWLYTGLSSATPLYDFNDGIARHSRSLAHELGSHSVKFWKEHGFKLKIIPQAAKHRYIRFLDKSWKSRLTAPVLPYPKKGESK
jgi:hypothetical protein